ncbi:penicillin-binding protein 1C [Ferruginibacter yonginensis]|uniref:peptidoglycan glycosyltransferase n=1 Tax=Ferruginibacter yonginensis TaxID=1310416 RepID=A0ABV8QTW4_9BACT
MFTSLYHTVLQWSLRKRITVFAVVGFLLLFYFLLPRTLFKAPTSYVIEDADGNLLNATIAADGQWRFPYNDDVPQHFIDCITTYEDKRFYTHAGVDMSAIARAFKTNVTGNKNTQGGSTITMQVMRLSLQHTNRSIFNKAIESLLALRLELSYSKNEIMALYASNASFGSNVVGLDAAAWRYFGRSAQKLSWAEYAMLAVLPNAPALVHPGKNTTVLLAKRNALLDKLCANKKLSVDECNLAKAEALPTKPLPLPQLAPHLLQRFKQENLTCAVTKITTTIQTSLQQEVTQIIERQHPYLQSNGINNMCALVLDVETGNTLAYVGNVYHVNDMNIQSDVDVINAPRSPGSALKPILYAAALSDGVILPNSLVPDVPTQIGGYNPQNFDLNYDGAVPASNALSRSLNIPAVKILQQYKYQRFYEVLQQCGIHTLNNPADFYGLSMILGGCEVKMWELAGVYASLARVLNHQKKYKGIVDEADFHPPQYTQNKRIKKSNTTTLPAIDATSIYYTFAAMQEVMRPGEEGLWQRFTSSQKIAWKTGTSFGFRDAWSIGVTSKYVVAVWAGNTSGEGKAGLIGVQVAAPVMFDIFRQLPAADWFLKPTYNYVFTAVCKQSGFRANIDCNEVDTLLMPPNALRSPLCPYHKIIQLDATGTFQVNESCASPATMQHASWFILPPIMEFYYKQHSASYKVLPPFQPGCNVSNVTKQMDLVYPQSDAKIYVPKEIDGQKGKTIFTATHRNSQAKIFWMMDNEFVGTTQQYHQLALSPATGKHSITLTDETGASITRLFEIIDENK